MGRIIGYQYDNDIKDDDAWIGTEATSRRTKQYTAQAVADYLNINGSISIVGQMSYRYSTAPLNGIGTFAIFGGGPNTVAFSAITKLTLSNQDISEQRVVEYLDLLVGSDMIISESGQISTFGYYSIGSYAPNATDSNYYDLSVTFKSGNGAMEYGKVYETQNFTLAAEENISTLQTTIDSGNTYQVSPAQPLWTWGTDAITVTSTSFTSLLSSKRFKTTFIADGSYTDVLPNQLIFNNALGNETSITPNTALSSNIDLQWPSSSGTVALTTDITASPWDTVLGGINYAGGNVGVGATSPSAPLDVATISSGPVAKFVNTSGTGGAGVVIQAGVATSSSILTLFDYQNNERLRVRGDGNVGIGTTSPGAALEVVGGGLGARLVSINTTALEVQGGANAQDIARFKNSVGNAKFVIDTNGNVGIGTTSPSVKLHVDSASVETIAYFRSTDNRGRISIADNDTTNYVISEGSKMSLGSNASLSAGNLTIDSSGKVGIGTTNPTVPLLVQYTDTHTSGDLALANSALDIYNDSSNDVAGKGSTITFSDTYSGANKTTRAAIKGGTDTAGNTADGFLAFYTDSGGANSMQEVARFNRQGRMGINTDSPRQLLDVDGNMFVQQITAGVWGSDRIVISQRANNDVAVESFASQLFLSSGFNGIAFEGSANTTLMYLNDSGNLGIGTTSPSAPLNIVNSNPKIVLEDSDNANTFGQIRQQAGNLQFLSNNNTSNGTIQFKLNNGTATTDVLNIISNGNVGIGTTSPTSKLDVAGGDIELDDVAAGIIMRSPDGTKYKITVANGGTLTVTAI